MLFLIAIDVTKRSSFCVGRRSRRQYHSRSQLCRIIVKNGGVMNQFEVSLGPAFPL
jgi:hypothetical protein